MPATSLQFIVTYLLVKLVSNLYQNPNTGGLTVMILRFQR